MKVNIRSLADVSIQLAVLGVLALLILACRGGISRASSPGKHPANCHACSTIPSGSTDRFERFLVQQGCVDDLRRGN